MSQQDMESETDSNRRRFLKTLGVLGVTGVAGCGGDGGDGGTSTATETTDGTSAGTGTPTPTPTPTPDTGLPDDPPTLISLDEDEISPETGTLNTTIANAYPHAIKGYSVDLEAPEGWELSASGETSFDMLEQGANHQVAWDLTLPDGANGEYDLTATATYARGDDDAEANETLQLTVDVWSENEFTEVATFNDFWDGVEDRKWLPGNGWTPDGSDEWGGQGSTNWYKYTIDLSAFLPADQIQIKYEDSFEGGWGASVWDTRLRADGEEAEYVRTVIDEDESDYMYENNSQTDSHSEDSQIWRYADTNSLGGAYWIYQFDVPDDPDELSVEITMRNGFTISARSTPESDVSTDDVSLSMTPALRVPYTGDDGSGVAELSTNYPQTPGRMFLLAPDFDLPQGPTYEYVDEGAVEAATPWDANEDIKAEFYFGYDEDNLYVRADVTDDTHVAESSADMNSADSLQLAARNGGYGPEYGVSRVNGGTETHEYSGGSPGGIDSLTVSTSRDEEENLTTYDLTIPWDALYDEFSAEPGANGPFSVAVNESDEDDGSLDAVFGWPTPDVGSEGTLDALGTLLLENPVGGN